MGLSGEAAVQRGHGQPGEGVSGARAVWTGPLPIYFTLLPGSHLRHGERLEELLQRYPSDFSDAGGGGRSRARTHGGCIHASGESD